MNIADLRFLNVRSARQLAARPAHCQIQAVQVGLQWHEGFVHLSNESALQLSGFEWGEQDDRLAKLLIFNTKLGMQVHRCQVIEVSILLPKMDTPCHQKRDNLGKDLKEKKNEREITLYKQSIHSW